jgi:hypothetical protein
MTEIMTFKDLENDVAIFRDKLLESIKDKPIEKSLFKGIQIYFSPIISDPMILFMGINPGAGYFNYNDELVDRLSPLDKHEYLVDEYNYTLKNNTIKLLELANAYYLLENSIKSNYYYVATNKETDIYNLFAKLELKNDFYEKSKFWTSKLIEFVNPKIIFCEGVRAFDKICEIIPCEKNKTEFWNYAKSEKYYILGYKRSYSNILYSDKVAEQLKILIEKIKK